MLNDRPILSVTEPPDGPVEKASESDICDSQYKRTPQDPLSVYTDKKPLESGEVGEIKFIHDLQLANKKTLDGKIERRFLKTIREKKFSSTENKIEARIEVMGQRYVRLGDLRQPVFDYVYDEEKDEHLVSSVAVSGFTAFANLSKRKIRDRILNGQYKSAGRKFFWRWALDDYDFNRSNAGTDQNGNIIILDGGWYLGGRYKKYANKITERDFLNFPYFIDFDPDFFLDHIERFEDKVTGKVVRSPIRGEGTIICKEMIDNPQFKRDFFEGVLQFIVMPDEFNKQFARAHIAEYATMTACGQSLQMLEDYVQPEFYQRKINHEAVKAKRIKDMKESLGFCSESKAEYANHYIVFLVEQEIAARRIKEINTSVLANPDLQAKYTDAYIVELVKKEMAEPRFYEERADLKALKMRRIHEIKELVSAHPGLKIEYTHAYITVLVEKEMAAVNKPDLLQEADNAAKIIIDRKNQMRAAALASPEFRRYLRSDEAKEALEHYLDTMHSYAEIDEDPVFTYVPGLENSVRETFTALQLLKEHKQIICSKIMRLSDHAQPNTLISQDEKTNDFQVSIASTSGITLFSELKPEEIHQNLLSGAYKGAGSKFFWKWALDDSQFDANTIGVDAAGNVTLLEAGAYLSKSVTHHTNKITLRDFDNFPLFEDYGPTDYLDYFSGKNKSDHEKIISKELARHPQFRREFHAATLQFILLPDAAFEAICQNTYRDLPRYVAEKLGMDFSAANQGQRGSSSVEFLLQRRSQMRNVALRSNHFQNYLKSVAAMEDLNKYLHSIDQFMGVDDALAKVPDLAQSLKENFRDIKIQHIKSKSKLEAIEEEDELEEKLDNTAEIQISVDNPIESAQNVAVVQGIEQQQVSPPHEPKGQNKDDQFYSPSPAFFPSRVTQPEWMLESKPVFPLASVVTGALMASLIGSLITAGIVAYGIVTLVTLGANLALMAGLFAAAVSTGALMGFALGDKEESIPVLRKMEVDHASPVDETAILSVSSEPIEPEMTQDSDLHVADEPVVNENISAVTTEKHSEAKQAVASEKTAEKIEVSRAKTPTQFNPPLAPFYRSESNGSTTSETVAANTEMYTSIFAHEFATTLLITTLSEGSKLKKLSTSDKDKPHTKRNSFEAAQDAANTLLNNDNSLLRRSIHI